MTLPRAKGIFLIALMAIATVPQLCSAIQSNTLYVVDDSTPTLGEIAVRLYGTGRKWRDIAKWNHLTPPYPLAVGQKLILEDPPTLTRDEGEKKLLEFWQDRLKVAPEETTEETRTPDSMKPEELFSAGMLYLDRNQYERAFVYFRKARELSPKDVNNWIYEIRTLRLLNRDKEARKTTGILLQWRPDLKVLPVFREMLKN